MQSGILHVVVAEGQQELQSCSVIWRIPAPVACRLILTPYASQLSKGSKTLKTSLNDLRRIGGVA